MARALIIAYGNPLRSDDGVAWRAAEQAQSRFSADDVEILFQQQLGPELAECASRTRCVIFLDAAQGPGKPGEIQINDLSTSASPPPSSRFGHAISPALILRLTAQLYGVTPKAYAATIVGGNFAHGETLSPPVSRAIPQLLSEIEVLLRQDLP